MVGGRRREEQNYHGHFFSIPRHDLACHLMISQLLHRTDASIAGRPRDLWRTGKKLSLGCSDPAISIRPPVRRAAGRLGAPPQQLEYSPATERCEVYEDALKRPSVECCFIPLKPSLTQLKRPSSCLTRSGSGRRFYLCHTFQADACGRSLLVGRACLTAIWSVQRDAFQTVTRRNSSRNELYNKPSREPR